MQNKGFMHNEVENATTIPAVPYKFIRCHGSETIIQIQMILFQVKIITIIHYRLTYFVLSRITNKLFNKRGLTVVTTRIYTLSIHFNFDFGGIYLLIIIQYSACKNNLLILSSSKHRGRGSGKFDRVERLIGKQCRFWIVSSFENDIHAFARNLIIIIARWYLPISYFIRTYFDALSIGYMILFISSFFFFQHDIKNDIIIVGRCFYTEI